VGTITFSGGSQDQQQAIRTAHSSLTTALPQAITAANAGGSGFAAWFGSTGSDAKTAVAGALQTSLNNLGQQNFAYDLTVTLPTLLHAPVCLLFVNVAASGVTTQLWDGFWSTYYLDAPAGATELALSIGHELLVSFNPQVVDMLGVDNPQAASALADADPAAAARCPANFTGFLSQFLPGT
jgi:hypothetical protein